MTSENEKIAQVGVAVLLRKGGEALLIKRQGSHDAGSWAPPGGHIDFGETPEQGGIRETQKEVGLAIDGLVFMGYSGPKNMALTQV
jgi:8-oxo-dGTP diphosphatase